MTNPFQSPEVNHDTTIQRPKVLALFFARFSTAMLLISVTGYLILAAWWLIGFTTPMLSREICHWLILTFGFALLMFCFPKMTARFPNFVSAVMISFGIMITIQVGLSSGMALELFMSWYSGVEYERFVVKQRLFGTYAWILWTNEICCLLLPLLIAINGIEKRRWIAMPALILLLLIILLNLRASYFFNHSDTLPSSWSMFFWG